MSDVPNKLEIKTDGTAPGTTVTFAGENVLAHEVEWRISTYDGFAEARVHLDVASITTQAGDVIWVGLEDVPSEVLEEELNRREEPS